MCATEAQKGDIMKKTEGYRNILVCREGNKIVTIILSGKKTDKYEKSCYSKQKRLKLLPFIYRARYAGKLIVADEPDITEIHVGDVITVTNRGEVSVMRKTKTFSI